MIPGISVDDISLDDLYIDNIYVDDLSVPDLSVDDLDRDPSDVRVFFQAPRPNEVFIIFLSGTRRIIDRQSLRTGDLHGACRRAGAGDSVRL